MQLNDVEYIMPERKVRPSTLTPLGDLLGLAQSGAALILGKQYSNLLF
jgi:hypothetical protein